MLLNTDPAPVGTPPPQVGNRIARNALLIWSAGGDRELREADDKWDSLDVGRRPRDAGFWHLRLGDDVILLSEPVSNEPEL